MVLKHMHLDTGRRNANFYVKMYTFLPYQELGIINVAVKKGKREILQGVCL